MKMFYKIGANMSALKWGDTIIAEECPDGFITYDMATVKSVEVVEPPKRRGRPPVGSK
jgi:hypothetical protein